MNRDLLPHLLRELADVIDQLEGGGRGDAWHAVWEALRAGNPNFPTDQYHTGTECAVQEIRRLYAVEETVKAALSSAGTSAKP